MHAQKISEEQLTAYVMGEGTADERAAVEAAMEADPALRAEAEELRAFCGTLWDELKEEPVPSLPPSILPRLGPSAPRRSFGSIQTAEARKGGVRRRLYVAALPALLAAAAVSAYVLVGPQGAQHRSGTREVRFVPAVVDEAASLASVPADKTPPQPLAVEGQKRHIAATRAHPLQPVKPAAKADLARRSAPLTSAAGKGLLGASGVTLAGPSMKGKADKKAYQPQAEAEAGYFAEDAAFNTEAYDLIEDNPFKSPAVDALSTFSSDVDTASYANIRRFLSSGERPPKDAVRIEEMLNYFRYDYQAPGEGRPFGVDVEVAAAPWQPKHRLVRIGLKTEDIDFSQAKPSNLVFLVDVSGSMQSPNKLPLLKQSLKLVLDKMSEKDRVAIVVYAGESGLALPSTPASEKTAILDAIDALAAGGSTNGAEGIELAYQTAEKNFIKDGINRVILATDGDFNVGVTSQGELVRLIEKKAKSGVFLSVLGYGMGNLKDSTLEKLAGKGNGNYAYVDSLQEARKVLVEEAGGTMITVAKDVKFQVEFNPAEVTAYRLIGYENRIMAHQDFNDDTKDAGDIGAGHQVTALYEVVPKGVAFTVAGVDPLKYTKVDGGKGGGNGELLTLKLRYKSPTAAKSALIEYAVNDDGKTLEHASADYRFAAAVAAFGMILRESAHKGEATFDLVASLAEPGLAKDQGGYRKDFMELVRKARTLK